MRRASSASSPTTRRAGSRRGRSSATASRSAGRSSPAAPERSSRSSRRTGAGRWPPTAASHPSCTAAELDPAWLDGCTHLHLPGYSLLRAPIDEASLRAAGLAPRVSVDLSSWSAIRDFGPARFRERLEALRPAIVFANEDEERILGGPLDGCTWVLKRGAARGALRRARAARGARRGGRHDRRRRRARGRLPRRRAGAGARRGGTLRRETRLHAVKDLIRVSDEVGHALAERRPVVALETTLVAHGFPPGEGVAVGLESERRVRDAGAVPATIGVLDGLLRVGLSEEELVALRPGRTQGGPARPGRRARPEGRRRDDGRRHAGGLPRRRDRLHGHRRPRRRPPRLPRSARRLGRSRRARPDRGADRLVGRQVDPRRAGDGRAARDARRAGARLPHRRPAALLRGARRPARLRPRRVGRGGRPRSRARTGASGATRRSCSAGPPRTASTTSSR